MTEVNESILSAKDFTEKEAYNELCSHANAIASPLASRKLTKKIYKLIKVATASKNKELVRNGLADVQKALRKNEDGIVVLAGEFFAVFFARTKKEGILLCFILFVFSKRFANRHLQSHSGNMFG